MNGTSHLSHDQLIADTHGSIASQDDDRSSADGRRVGQCLLGGKGPDSVQACFDAIAAGGEDDRCPLVVEYAQAVADSCGLAATGTAL